MFDLSWGEMMLVGAVALIVIGPKDLPGTLRAVGQMVGKVRRMASEFQGQFNQAMREAELDQVRKDVEGISRAAKAGYNPAKAARDELKRAIDGSPGAKAASGDAGAASAGTSGPSLEKKTPAAAPSLEKAASPAASAGDDPGAVAASPPASAATPVEPAPAPAAAPAPIPAEPVRADEREEVKP
ncbi:Sec-independent protein translocase protein TatB [Salinarimonas ramus]|uniref:Sec-independent protein translocase protein TatB n=1 Tax=Salinarimonas ramus TaxID=690164 RepID=A0A917V8B7_9HYPH|nr:Sec-independent protein translocase protein TatB [Salinarimonas ramus]GGK49792.1 hypothetical protein GCM10011322_40990 [Salinarimonas ramus]